MEGVVQTLGVFYAVHNTYEDLYDGGFISLKFTTQFI